MSSLDWMGVVTLVIEAAILFLSRLKSDQFTQMFAEMGGDLPLLTKIVLTPAYGAAWGLVLLLLASTNWWPTLRGRESAKRTAMVIGFVTGLGAIAAYMVGLYMPLFQTTANVAP